MKIAAAIFQIIGFGLIWSVDRQIAIGVIILFIGYTLEIIKRQS